jgi:hypothetical protein
MYTLLLDNDNAITQSERKALMQHSSLVDDLQILVPYLYNSIDMRDFTCTIEYVYPISKKYKTETLVADEDLYKDNYIRYTIPVNSKLSEQAGNVELQLTFTKVELDEDGNKQQYVRHTKSTIIPITPITNWSDLITDESLTALDNRILAIDGQIKALNELQGDISAKIPDDLKLTKDLLQLTIDGEAVGDGVQILTLDEEQVQEDVSDGNNDGIIQLPSVGDGTTESNNNSSNETDVDNTGGNENIDTGTNSDNVSGSDNSESESNSESTEENNESGGSTNETDEGNTENTDEQSTESSEDSNETTEA